MCTVNSHMRKRVRALSISAGVVVAATAAIVLVPGRRSTHPALPDPIDPAEHQRAIEALKPPKRERPVIAILALNNATEITDLMVPYGVLSRARVADVMVVAERAEPVSLHPFS